MNNIDPQNILLIGRNWSTRGNNNDFEHFLKFFPGSINVTSKKLKKFDNKIYRYLKFKTGNSCYSSLSVALEYSTLFKLIKNEIKLIHYWFGDHDYYYGYLFKRFFGIKLIVNLFFSIEELKNRMPNKTHLKHADLITCSGYAQLEYLEQFIEKEKLVYLPLGVDTNFFSVPKYSEERNKNLIICVGNNRRDYKTLKKIYIRIKNKNPNIKLKLAGSKPGKKYFIDYPEVEFLPFLDDIKFRNLFREASLLILPLLEGGSSQTLNESLSCGLPVVTNKFPNLTDYTKTEAVIEHAPGDYKNMANTCINLLRDKKKLYVMSLAGRKHMENFDFFKIKNKLIDIYSNYLNINIKMDK